MDTTEIAHSSPNARWLIPEHAGRNMRHRLAKYASWLDDHGLPWYRPDLEAYRDYLLAAGSVEGSGLRPSSTSAHLATVRARYRRLLRQGEVRDAFLGMAGRTLAEMAEYVNTSRWGFRARPVAVGPRGEGLGTRDE